MALSRKQRVVGGILIGIIIVVAGIGLWWFVMQRPAQMAADKAIKEALGSGTAAWGKRVSVTQALLAKHDTQGGIDYYDKLLAHTTNKDDKQTLLLEAAQFALTGKQYNAALDYANQAEAIKRTIGTVTQKARVYEAMGDKAKAISEYQAAIDMAKQDTTGLGRRYSYQWRTKIKELSQ